MKAGIIVFPGSNCDRDVAYAIELATGHKPQMLWHKDATLPELDLIIIPGGFSYGDYLRSGAMAGHSPIMQEVKKFAGNGGYVIGICNGFQILTEAELLPGVLMRNQNLKFICRDLYIKVENNSTIFTNKYNKGAAICAPVAHHDGCYFADSETLKSLNDNNQIIFRYADKNGAVNDNTNPNGSLQNIAGIINKTGNVLGLMPHPERSTDIATGNADGRKVFESIISGL